MSDLDKKYGALLDGMAPAASVSGGTASPLDDKYGGLLDQAETANRVQAGLTLHEADTMNPDQAAKAAQLASQSGLPPELVERNMDDVERSIAAQRRAETIAQNRDLAKFYQDRQNAVVAHDDWAGLDVLSRIWRSGARGIQDSVSMNDASRTAAQFLGRTMDPATDQAVRKAQDATRAAFGGDDSAFYSFVRHAAGFIGGLVDQGIKAQPAALVGGLAGGTAGAVGGPLAPVTAPAGAAVGYSVGFTAGMVADGFEVGAGQMYLALKDQRDANGQPLDPDVVKYTSLGAGAILGLLNMVGAKGLEKSAAGVVTGVANMFIADAVAKPTTRQALATLGKGIATGAATGAAFGGVNEATMIAAETIAKSMGGEWATVMNDPVERDRAFNRMLSASLEMGAAFGVMHGVGGSVRFAGDMARVRRAEADAAWIDQVNQGIVASKTAGRDRDAVKRFLEAQADGSPIEHVFIPRDKVIELYQSHGLDPFALTDDPIFPFQPDVAEQIQQSRATGGDIVLPAADYFAKLGGSDVFNRLQHDIRVRQEGMSFNGARTAAHELMAKMEQQAADWRAAAERGDEDVTPAQRVYSDVFNQARKAGYTNDAAAHHAALYASRYQSRAERMGGDAWEQYQRSGVEIRSVMPDGLRYIQPDDFDVLLNSLRSGKDPAAPKDTRMSLLNWIAARGGMVDAGGELKARDLDKWHLSEKGRPLKGRNPVVVDGEGQGQGALFGGGARGPRRTLDDVTLAAWEDGFFPEHSDRPSIDVLLKAIDEELAGRPRFMEDAPHDPRAAFRQAREELDILLNQHGIDIKTMRNKDIKAALAKLAEEEQGGEGYFEQAKRTARDLIIQHSLSVKNLLHSVKMGGIAVPSLAITKASGAISSFGEITLLGNAAMADPRGYARPKVFGADVYSPRYPSVSFKLDAKQARDLRAAFAEGEAATKSILATDQIAEDGVRYLERDAAVMWTFLKEQGIEPKLPAEDGRAHLKVYELEKQIRDAGLQEKLTEFAAAAFDRVSPAERIFMGFTNAGNRRYIPHTLDNVVRLLKKDLRGGESAGNFYGVGQLRAKFTPQFRSVEQIRKAGDRLISREEMEAVKKEIDNDFFSIVEALKPYYSHSADGFRFTDTVMGVMEDTSRMSLNRALDEYGFRSADVPDSVRADVGNFLNHLRNMPTEYFEAKILRQVDLAEFAGAVVPEGTGEEALSALRDRGVTEIATYKAGDAADRKRVVEELSTKMGEKVLFQDARGSIIFSEGRSLIQLFKQRDLSTLIHESGHLWLQEMQIDAMRPDAPEQIKKDFAIILDAIGARGKATIERHHHENFARAFEQYIMEGKAPSEGLRAAFQSFKQWLVQIYRNLTTLNAYVDNDLRGVFDRIIASDAEIAAASEKQGLNPIFKSAADAGMTEAEYAAYTQAASRAIEGAQDAALRRAMEDIRRRRTKEWKAEEKATREEVMGNLMSEPGHATLHLLRTGKLWGEGVETPEALRGLKLDREQILEMYGDETALKMLPAGIYREKGVDVETLAEAMGFNSGKALVERLMGIEKQRQDLRAAGDNRSVVRHLAEEETRQRMTERHGDALSDGSIEAEAIAAVNSDRQGMVMSTELKALAKQAGTSAPSTWATIKAWAADQIADMKVRDATMVSRWIKAERDAGIRVQRALLAGDKVEAFKAKQEQVINAAMIMEAKKAERDRDGAVRMMDRYASARTMGSMAQEYLEQIHGLLERFDFKRATQKELDRRADFAEWAIQQQAEGVDIVAPEKFVNAAYRQHYTDMTVGEMRGLADTVRQIAHLGRMKTKLKIANELREFNATVDEAVSVVAGLPQVTPPGARNPGVAGRGATEGLSAWWERVKAGGRSAHSSLRKIESIFDVLDAGNPNGVFNSVIFRPIAEAQGLEARLQKEVTQKLLDLNRALPKAVARDWSVRHEIPELIDSRTGKPSSMLKHEVVAIALNMGNASNKDKLLRGEKWDPDAVRVVLDRLMTKADWDYVQGVWDTVNTLWPYAEAVEKAVNGVAPEKKEPLAVETPHGTYRGGYYPVVYDPLRAGDVADRAARNSDKMFEDTYTRATTSRGFMNERVEGYARPFLLSLDVIPRHISEVVHDIAFREVIRQADKFLSDKRIREAVEGAMGREIYTQFRPWLQHIANEWAMDRKGLTFWENLARGARTSASIVGMGLRATTMMAQVSGLSDSAEFIGARWMARGVADFVGDPLKMARTRDFVFEKSSEMRNRMDNTERDVRDALRTLTGRGGLVAETRRFAFYGIGMVDMAVSLPTWMGAYKKALSEGMADADAVYYADKAVRSSQGAGAAKDLAAIQRGGEGMKLWTMFYSYFNHMYNRQADLVRDARNVKGGRDVAMIAARSFFLLMVPPLIGNLVSGQGPKEDDDYGAWAARKIGANMFLGVPVLRDAVNVAERKMSGEFASYQATPAARAVDVIQRAASDAIKTIGGDEPSDDWVKHALETSGYIFGLPTGQIGNTVQFLWDVNDGRQAPETVADWFKGLVYGRFEDRKH